MIMYLLFTFFLGVLAGQEKVTLDSVATSEYTVTQLSLSWTPPECQIFVSMAATSVPPRLLNHTYSGADACAMLQALNKADLSKVSLQRRILERLITDKVISGKIAGVPE